MEKVLYDIYNSNIWAWVRGNEEELKGLSFGMSMSCLRGELLLTDWEFEVAKALTKKQEENEKYLDWASGTYEVNDTLGLKSEYYIMPQEICKHLFLHCYNDLHHKYKMHNEYKISNIEGSYNYMKDFSK